MTELVLSTAIANYGHTVPLKDGSIGSPMFRMEHTEVSPVPMIFRRMVRTLEFDVAEMALATYLCSRAHGKRFTALPVFPDQRLLSRYVVLQRQERHRDA